MKYFKVYTKCGHVRKNFYVLKWLYVKAESKKEAASIARFIPRVKHHHKDAIREVIEVSYEDYQDGIKKMYEDKYFLVKNSSQQRKENALEGCEIFKEEKKLKYKKEHNGQRLRLIEFLKDEKKLMQGGYCFE